MRLRVVGLPAAICAVLLAIAFSVPATVSAKAPAEGLAVEPADGSVSRSSAGGIHPLERVQRRIVRDRDHLLRGGRLRLGALSDGNFDIRLFDTRSPQSQTKVVIVMPPLRARHLERTRKLVMRRYAGAPVVVGLARLQKPRRLGRSAVVPRPGEPLLCPARVRGSAGGDWNAKQIVGMPLGRAERVASRNDCSVRVVFIDGMSLATRSDLRQNRINVIVRFGKVIRILGIA